jgi:hypothetical protein
MTGDRTPVNRGEARPNLDDLPPEVADECRQIAREIGEQGQVIRDKKVLVARIRICSGFYDSDRVLDLIASRVLSESGMTRPAS